MTLSLPTTISSAVAAPGRDPATGAVIKAFARAGGVDVDSKKNAAGAGASARARGNRAPGKDAGRAPGNPTPEQLATLQRASEEQARQALANAQLLHSQAHQATTGVPSM